MLGPDQLFALPIHPVGGPFGEAAEGGGIAEFGGPHGVEPAFAFVVAILPLFPTFPDKARPVEAGGSAEGLCQTTHTAVVPMGQGGEIGSEVGIVLLRK